MSTLAIVFVLVNAVALLLLPRRWAPLPLLVGACYMTLGQGVEVGPFTFTVIRILAAVGLVRVLLRRERLAGGLNRLDVLMLIWAVWACISSIGHEDAGAALVFRLGLAYNACGIYFLLRIFCTSMDDVVRLCRSVAVLLTPIAVVMLLEHLLHYNLFAALGGVPDEPVIRAGRIRALGPFAHPVLAGTVGAVSLPLMIAIWRDYRKTAVLGLVACILMILSSASSGPVLTAVCAVAALCMWRYRTHLRSVRWFAVGGYVALEAVMNAPAYYLLARIDIAGGSTGWYRARLIESAFEHLNEWWLTGTDVTRHWMPTGVPWSPTQSDITNHYVQMGVTGGLPLMLLLIAVLVTAFSFVGGRLRQDPHMPAREAFLLWALGSMLFAHASTSLAISYFDQSFLFLYLAPAAIGSLRFERPEAEARRADESVRAIGGAHPPSDRRSRWRTPGSAQGLPAHVRTAGSFTARRAPGAAGAYAQRPSSRNTVIHPS